MCISLYILILYIDYVLSSVITAYYSCPGCTIGTDRRTLWECAKECASNERCMSFEIGMNKECIQIVDSRGNHYNKTQASNWCTHTMTLPDSRCDVVGARVKNNAPGGIILSFGDKECKVTDRFDTLLGMYDACADFVGLFENIVLPLAEVFTVHDGSKWNTFNFKGAEVYRHKFFGQLNPPWTIEPGYPQQYSNIFGPQAPQTVEAATFFRQNLKVYLLSSRTIYEYDYIYGDFNFTRTFPMDTADPDLNPFYLGPNSGISWITEGITSLWTQDDQLATHIYASERWYTLDMYRDEICFNGYIACPP